MHKVIQDYTPNFVEITPPCIQRRKTLLQLEEAMLLKFNF